MHTEIVSHPQVRRHLKERGYKAGRISQLIRATRPEGTEVGSGHTKEVEEAEVAEEEAVETEELEGVSIFAEVASEEEEEWHDAMEEDNAEEVARVLQEAAAEDNQEDLNLPEVASCGT